MVQQNMTPQSAEFIQPCHQHQLPRLFWPKAALTAVMLSSSEPWKSWKSCRPGHLPTWDYNDCLHIASE
eukprot:2161555-Alexandrium_andersonii.AAC.1